MPTILAVESSCDDTSVAIASESGVLAHVGRSQLLHETYGGVVPELASREHLAQLLPLTRQALKLAGISTNQIDAFAVTAGPGLPGALMVGISFVKSLSLVLNKPLIAVHHMHAHIMAHFIDPPKPSFPLLCLTVSGGHTQLVYLSEPFEFKVIGQTLDDAAGEAFDKGARMLGLPYPGGPHVDALARQGNPSFLSLPISKVPGLNFSFSGLKTSLSNALDKGKGTRPDYIEVHRADLCASLQRAIIEMLIQKLKAASQLYPSADLALAGGVAANGGLQQAAATLCAENGCRLHLPKLEYCTDNAAMIAQTAMFYYTKGHFARQDLVARPRWPLSTESLYTAP
ncbi:MAG: tRNA (adenosine(37)-N6)-threonylcarbamoyltransferase complex transferase subunit TsaD [Sphingomonadales bacterium]|nr:tRNA (adenosine(37)-N6)-threonylcarbamoyltransferase complex transferase subunit TsaD [Sphingomonadales bacterium]